MSTFSDTLAEISKISLQYHIRCVVTRFDRTGKVIPDDIDLLVPNKDYQKMIEVCKNFGYNTSSHDEALGGRTKGMQINLVRPLRVKIDLHRDFTWRKSRYFDLDLVWESSENMNMDRAKIEFPRVDVDAFIVMINILFEKTYINKADLVYLSRSKEEIFSDKNFELQARKYHWDRTFSLFKHLVNDIKTPAAFPVFLPVSLVLHSYLEKFLGEHKIDVISFLYYFFFRIRYKITRVLPYE